MYSRDCDGWGVGMVPGGGLAFVQAMHPETIWSTRAK